MTSHISIPELDHMGLSYEENFRSLHVFLKHYLLHLKEKYNSTSIDDLKAYPLSIASRIVKMASTLNSIIERDKDYVVANIVIRSIADSISAYILIYHEPNNEEKLLRHYLYVSDGLNERIKQLKNKPENDGRIKINEYEELSKQIIKAEQNYQNAHEHSIMFIKTLSIYNGYKHAVDELIRLNNWKYTNIGSYKKKYTWKELYSKLDLNMSYDFFSTQSEFVHGLSTSNFTYDNDIRSFEPLYGIAFVLIGKLFEILKTDYIEDQAEILSKMPTSLHDEKMPQNYLNWISRQCNSKV